MLVDHRTYRIKPTHMNTHLAIYQEFGLKAQWRHLGEPHAYMFAESGAMNSLVHQWVYKDAADRGAIQIKADSVGYPPDLQTLVDGVDVQEKKVRFLRAIPVDPMTKSSDWGLRSNQDDADADTWGGQNVFDVYTRSYDTALDGTKYSTW